jgi:anthranilate synthase component I
VQAGAGIVYDSDPPYEYRECVAKARGMIKAAEEAASQPDAVDIPLYD